MDSANHDQWGDNWAYERVDADSALDYYKVVRTKADFSTDASDDEMDKDGHGTNVAGAIAKSTPNNVKLSCYKTHNQNGDGTSATALAAFEYIKQLSNKPDIINCSFVTRSGLGSVVDELVDIYYTTDGTLPIETNGTKYTAPIDLTESTRIIAAAFAIAGTLMHSKFTYLDYYILSVT